MFDPILLQTFVAVAGSRSFTGAAVHLRLGQSTVSQHIRRLGLVERSRQRQPVVLRFPGPRQSTHQL